MVIDALEMNLKEADDSAGQYWVIQGKDGRLMQNIQYDQLVCFKNLLT